MSKELKEKIRHVIPHLITADLEYSYVSDQEYEQLEEIVNRMLRQYREDYRNGKWVPTTVVACCVGVGDIVELDGQKIEIFEQINEREFYIEPKRTGFTKTIRFSPAGHDGYRCNHVIVSTSKSMGNSYSRATMRCIHYAKRKSRKRQDTDLEKKQDFKSKYKIF